MKFASIRVVLVATSHPGNIGASARAMKTMGLSQLYLVNPKKFPHQQAIELSAGAEDILNHAVVVASLEEALQDCHLVIGASARPRGLNLPGLSPKECATLVDTASHTMNVAVVFGREHAGLTNDELLQCHYHVLIPSVDTFSSLNLSHAVQVIAYELRAQSTQKAPSPVDKTIVHATHDEVENFFHHLQKVLLAIDFLKISNPKRMFQRVRRMFNRIRLEHIEVQILRGMLSNIESALETHQQASLPLDDASSKG